MTELTKPVRVMFLVIIAAMLVGVVQLHARNAAAAEAPVAGGAK
jgi:hypothetical protein